MIGRVLVQLLSGTWLEELQGYYSTPEGYIAYIRLLSSLAGIDDLVQPLIQFYEIRLVQIGEYISCRPHPRVFCALSHPLLPAYPDKMEVSLAARAGGDVLNFRISYNESQTAPFSPDQFLALNPEVIICTGMGKTRIENFYECCSRLSLTARALETKQVFSIPPAYDLNGLTWILALDYLTSILHPGLTCIHNDNDEFILNELLSHIREQISCRLRQLNNKKKGNEVET